mmetsp:Transcript_99154/g.212474  ORF Transcript_99154/g.212474 Transcript_99154/m.212474 type:complete len:354 (-) Transcript_99154:56-1117(-)
MPHSYSPEENPAQHVQCDWTLFINANKSSKNTSGLIISGQGGSATRAAQEVVEYAGTHAFGALDERSRDSLAWRWATSDIKGKSFYDPHAILMSTGSINYTVEEVPQELRVFKENQACRTILNIEHMLGNSVQPWALKEPLLRYDLPFYMSMVSVKFLHVTRDVRNIHMLHYDVLYYDDLFNDGDNVISASDADKTNSDFDIASAYQLCRNMAFISMNLTLPCADNAIRQLTRQGDRETLTRFARVWAKTELDLYKTWTRMWPERYYHISEIKMTNESNKRTEALRLAQFLGNPQPDENTLAKMTSVYQPEHFGEHEKRHWEILQSIVVAPDSGMIREALTTFGYEVYKQTPS